MTNSDSPDIANENEVREVFSDRRWTIMGALLGTSTAILLVHSLEPDKASSLQRDIGLGIIASTLPFMVVYCALHLYARENEERMLLSELHRLSNLSIVCQLIAYGSMLGILTLWYGISEVVGPLIIAASAVAFLTVRYVLYTSTSASPGLSMFGQNSSQ
ncbi:MAG TPA: hypothetical protein HA345_02525 [Candidatus Thalassarchaeaceae archaeon]|nr:MAG TPA: hypothetical protein D7H94_02520 [Candidatus Poseidoniales archaeon]HIH84264.1 hypothetical protein [Candidatus Thalassarchaeaceae archaeon]